MLTDTEVQIVGSYFRSFYPAPAVALDTKQNDADESYILIEGGGLSIGKHLVPAQQVISQRFVPGYVYRIYDETGSDDGTEYKDLGSAVKVAMIQYATEMFRRVNDQLATAAQAEDFLQHKDK